MNELSIVFPAFNEELNIADAVNQAFAYLQGKRGEVVVVNDGSQDRTHAVLMELKKKYGDDLRVLHHPVNLGYGTTLKDGFLSSQGQWIFYSDSDLQFELSEIDLLWDRRHQADMIVGYRKNRQDPQLRIFLAACYNFLIRKLFGVRVRDVDCAFKLFHRSVFEKMTIDSRRFLVDAEILAKAKVLGISVLEIGVTHKPRTKGQSTVRWVEVFRTFKELIHLRLKL